MRGKHGKLLVNLQNGKISSVKIKSAKKWYNSWFYRIESRAGAAWSLSEGDCSIR